MLIQLIKKDCAGVGLIASVVEDHTVLPEDLLLLTHMWDQTFHRLFLTASFRLTLEAAVDLTVVAGEQCRRDKHL